MSNLTSWKNFIPSVFGRSKNPFLSLQKELDNLSNDFYQSFQPSFLSKEIENLAIRPSIDIVEDEKNFKVEIEMPGVGEDDIDVSINNGMLTITAKKETSQKDENKNYVRREIGYGSYEATIGLPDYVEADKPKASFKKGMLWVNFPKKAGAATASKKIKIEKVN